MKGSIRVIVGLLMALGAVGTLDTDANSSVLVQAALAVVGLVIMVWGVNAMAQKKTF